MNLALRDFDFKAFDWKVQPDGDLARTEGLESFRFLIIRWLLTEPSEKTAGLIDEEIENRRKYGSEDARKSQYDAPGAFRMNACLPWSPNWGAGIKRFVGAPLTATKLSEIRTRVFAGLRRLQGVVKVVSVDVSTNAEGRLRVSWKVQTVEFGTVSDQTEIRI